MSSIMEIALIVGSAVTGVVWLLDIAWLRRKRVGPDDTEAEAPPWWIEYSRAFFPVLFAVLILRSFVFEPFRIPSGSMMPSLLVGDFIFVNKFTFGLRLPITRTRIVPLGEPRRGDVIVFHYPERHARVFCRNNPLCQGSGGMQEVERSAGEDYIKRIIGLPGDTVRSAPGNRVYINGKPVPMEHVSAYQGEGSNRLMGSMAGVQTQVYEEAIPRRDGSVVRNRILVVPGVPYPMGTWKVPAGEYLVMGDNRDNSFDSRYWGFVPARNILGKAFIVWFNYYDGHVQWNRIGKTIPQ
ncbi:MAG: signal peptidase I [Gammaproteobacteria bacterium]